LTAPLPLPRLAAWTILICGGTLLGTATSGCSCRVSPPDDTAPPVDSDTDGDTAPDSPTETGDDTGPHTGDPWQLETPIALTLLENGWKNHMMPNNVYVDEANGLVYNSAFMSGSVAQIDADTGELLEMFDLGAFEHTNPHVVVDDQGIVWVSSNSPLTPLLRLDPSDGGLVLPEVGGRPTYSITPRPGGGVVISQREGDDGALVAVNAAGDGVDAENLLDTALLDVEGVGDGSELAVLTLAPKGSRITIYDWDTLEPDLDSSCDVGIQGSQVVKGPEGRFVVMNATQITTPGCDGGDVAIEEFGFLATEIVSTPHGLIALERHGDEQFNDGALYGLAFRYSENPLTLEGVTSTGHNTGYGDYDSVHDRIWINSEGEGALWGLDPVTGELERRTRMAEHAETILVDQDDPNTLIVGGRLSYFVGRADLLGGTYERSDDQAYWPMGMTQIGRKVYYFDQIYSKIRAYDIDTLELEVDWDLPSTVLNEIHTFGGLVYNPTRDSFFVGYSKGSMVIEVDAQTGEELQTWPLAGHPISPTDHGVLELFMVGERVYCVMSTTTQVTVIDPDQATIVAETALEGGELATIGTNNIYLLSYLSEDQSVLYLGGYAHEAETLARLPELDREVTAMVGQYGAAGEVWIGWDADNSKAIFMDTDGFEIHQLDLERDEPDEDGHPDFAVDEHWGGRFIYTDMSSATIHVEPLDFL